MDSPGQSILTAAVATVVALSACGDPTGGDTGSGDDPTDVDAADTTDASACADAGDCPTPDTSPDGHETRRDADDDSDDEPVEPCVECLENPVWDLRVSDSEWDRLHVDVNADVRVRGVLVVDDVEYEIGVELQGSTSRRYPKRSLKLHFDDDGPLIRDPFGLDENLRFDELILKASYKDQSFVREALAWELLRRLDMPAPRTTWVNLTLGGEYHGLFVLTEPIDRDYLRRRGFDDDGSLYKAVDQVATMAPSMDVDAAFEKRTREDEPWDDLYAFVDLLQDTPATVDAFYEDIDPVWPLDEWLDRLIWVSFTQNLDSWRNNFFLYNEGSLEEPDWTMLAWDSDICFAQHWRNSAETYDVSWSYMLDGNAYFGERTMSIDPIRHDHVERFRDVLDTVYAPSAVVPTFDAMAGRVAADAAVDLAFWDRPSTPEAEHAEIRDFLERRPGVLLEQLEAFHDDPDIPDYRE